MQGARETRERRRTWGYVGASGSSATPQMGLFQQAVKFPSEVAEGSADQDLIMVNIILNGSTAFNA
jgi:hypothetical protein